MKNSIFFLLLISHFSCDPVVYNEVKYYKEYFPIKLQREKHFLVTNIIHSSFGKDTSSYYLKEIIAESFIDLQGDTAYRLERYSRIDTTDNYNIKDVWVVKKSTTSVQQTEENINYTKLIFPINENSFWNGNVFNNLGYQEYVVQSIHTNFTLNDFTFDSCVTINQNYKSNLLQYENTEEIYSLGLGLVYKEEIVTQINNGDKNDISQGSEYIQELIEY
tara:strand:- start:133 stop:789 length:657 start_codon:yes stop_codon:yes gene_type:complete